MNIVVTGASGGIGYEVVRKLSEGNHNLLAIARRKEELVQLQKECMEHNSSSRIFIVALDIVSVSNKSLSGILKEHGFDQVDALVNNAGLLINRPFLEISQEEWMQVYQVNVFAVANLTRILHPFMLKSGHRHIVNISSMGGIGGTSKFPGLSAYSSSKGALCILTECLAEEFKTVGITVNALALGAVQSEMLSAAFPGYKAPLQPSEMAEYIAWFIVHGNKFFNGKIIPVSVSNP